MEERQIREILKFCLYRQHYNFLYFEPGKKIRGSVYAIKAYAAPETFDEEYKPGCADMWACGIVLFFLLKQNVPWEAANEGDGKYLKWYRSENKEQFFSFPRLYGDVSVIF